MRKQKHLLNPKIKDQHVNIDGKKTMSDELVRFAPIAVKNIKST